MNNYSALLEKHLSIGETGLAFAFFERHGAGAFDGQSLLLTAKAYIEKSRYADALPVLKKAFKNSGSPECLLELGRASFLKGAYSRAVHYLSFCLRREPLLYDAHYYIAKTYKTLNDFENALAHLVWCDKSSDSPESWADTAEVLFELKKNEEAIVAWRQVLRITPGNPEPLKMTGINYFELQEMEKALSFFKQYETARESREPDFELFFYLGRILTVMGKDSEGREYLKAILTAHPDNNDTLLLLFDSHLKYIETKECIEYGERVLKIKTVLRVAAELAIIYYREKIFDKSREMIEILLARGVESIAAIRIIVTAFIQMEDFEKAFTHAKRLYLMERSDGNLFFIAHILFREKKYKKAVHLYFTLLKKNREERTLRMEYSRILYALEKKAEAYKNLQYLLQNDPGDAEALYLLSQISFEYMDYTAPVELINLHLKKNPKNHKAWYLLAICQENQGHYLNAARCLTRAVQLDKNEAYKKKRMELIQKFYAYRS